MVPESIRVFGIPMDLGQQRRGVDMGPSALRYAGLHRELERCGARVFDAGNINVPVREQLDEADRVAGGINAFFLHQNAAICQATYERITTELGVDEVGVFLGGDHSMSIGTVSAMASRGETGVLWIDAHGDFNTPESSPSGNIHGMALAALVGDGPPELTGIGYAGQKVQPHNIAMIGVRDLDDEERVRLTASGITVYTMREVDEIGMYAAAKKVLDRFAYLDRIHVSLDLDACDPELAPGVGTPVIGGLTYREVHLLMETLASSQKIRSVDVVEINPILDSQNRTARIAVEFVSSLLGKRIM
jgi:arginase